MAWINQEWPHSSTAFRDSNPADLGESQREIGRHHGQGQGADEQARCNGTKQGSSGVLHVETPLPLIKRRLSGRWAPFPPILAG